MTTIPDFRAVASVSERLPEPSAKVLAHYFNDLGNGRTICAIWVPAKTRSDSDGDDDFTEYDIETDKFYWPEGWYEVIENWEDLGYVKVNEGEVVYWQPLPEWPARTALATPPPEPPTVMEIFTLIDEIDEAGLDQIDLVRAALERWDRPATPPPEPPTDDELWAVGENYLDDIDRTYAIAFARATLKRWGR